MFSLLFKISLISFNTHILLACVFAKSKNEKQDNLKGNVSKQVMDLTGDTYLVSK